MLLTKDAILAAKDRKREKVEVPEWGGYVFVQSMSGFERDEFESSLINRKGKSREANMRNMRAKLVANTVVDENGVRLFTDADIEALGGKSASALDRLFDKAQELSGFREEDVEELTKNSENPPGEETSSDLPPSGDVQ